MDNQNNLQKAKTSNLIEFQPSKMLNIPSSAIHIQNDISLTQKKLWFELVYHALPTMSSQRKYSIPLNKLRELLGWNETTSNDKELKEALYALSKTAIQWNLFGKDKKRVWESFALLAGCQIPDDSGICIFDFSSFLEKRFLAMGQEAYLKIDLIISKKFQSKYALSIYCLALDYLIIEKGYSEKKFSIEELRKYLGVKEEEYKLIGHFNDRVIKPAEEEINSNSDMNIEIKPYKEGRKIVGYKLCMSLKEGRAKEYIEKKETFKQIENKQTNIFENIEVREIEKVQSIKPEVKPKREIIKVESKELKEFFAEYKISITTNTIQDKFREAKDIFQDNFEKYLIFLMNYTKQELKRNSINSISGFFVSLFKDDVQIDNYFQELEKETKRKEVRKFEIESKLESKVKEKYNNSMSSDFENYLEKNIDSIEDKFIEIVRNNVKKGFAYDYLIKNQNKGIIDKSLLLNYKKHIRMPLITEIKLYEEELGYRKPTFEEWKKENITEKYLSELRLEIKKLDT